VFLSQSISYQVTHNNFSGGEADLLYFLVAVVTDEVPLVASRLLLQIFAQELNKLEPEAHKEIAQYALAQIQPRVVSFEEQVLFCTQSCLGTCVYSVGMCLQMLGVSLGFFPWVTRQIRLCFRYLLFERVLLSCTKMKSNGRRLLKC
jgi:hypothetical protein